MLPKLSGVVLEGIEGTIGRPLLGLPVLVYQRNAAATAVTLRLGPAYLAQTCQIVILGN